MSLLPTSRPFLPRRGPPDQHPVFLLTDFLSPASQVKSPISTIVCNSAELEILNVTVTGSDGVTQRPTSVELNAEVETLTCRLAEPLAVGSAQMRLQFAAPLTDKMRGLYRCKYTRWVRGERGERERERGVSPPG